MHARINSDGKLVERFIPAVLAAAITVVGTGFVFWRDSAVADNRSADASVRIDKEITAIKRDQIELRREASVDRQETSDLTSDVKVLLAITQRVEKVAGQLNLRERASP